MRIGILGGTFDPIHNGHLALASEALKKLKLDQILLIPTAVSPISKEGKAITPAKFRFKMVELAIAGNPKFCASDIEIRRKGVSYSVDTLRELRRQYPVPHELFWLVGADWAASLDQWKEMDVMVSLCQMVVASRSGFDLSELPNSVISMEFVPLQISSSEIRHLIKTGKDVGQFIPKSVSDFISQKKLYQ